MSDIKLPENIPERGETAERLLAWVNKALGREHNPIMFVNRYGLDLDARLELVMSNGDQIRVRQRELMGANGLRHIMLGYDGTVIKGYDQASCARIVSRLIWASETNVRDDETETLIDDLSGFLTQGLGQKVVRGRYDDDNGWRLIADFVNLNRRARFAVFGVNEVTEPITLWIPRGGLVNYLRERREKAHAPDVRSLLHKLGWHWQDFQRRTPTDPRRRPIARAYVGRSDWEQCPFDLAAEVENAQVHEVVTR